MSLEMLKNECRFEGREEGREEGRAEGEKKGRDETLYNLVCHGDLTVKRAAEIAGSTQTAFRANMLKAGFAMP